MKYHITVYGPVNYYNAIAALNSEHVKWNAVNRQDGGWDIYIA